jgi:copper chaperone
MKKFSVPEMSCGHCKSAVESAIKEVDENAQIVFDMTEREVTVSGDAEAGDLVTSMKAGGYEAYAV